MPDDEYQIHHKSPAAKPPRTIRLRTLFIVAVIAAACAVSFLAGLRHQKTQDRDVAAIDSQSTALDGPRQKRGSAGNVTAISNGSVTIHNQRTDNKSTYEITSRTAVTDDGKKVPASDIKTGDTVIIEATSPGSGTAGRIMVNPDLGDPPRTPDTGGN